MQTETDAEVDGAIDAGRDALVATCWGSAGDAASDRADLRSPLPLRDRIEAAARAGFTGFGLLSADLPAAVDTYGLSGIRSLLDDNGMTVLELEDIPRWWQGDDADEEALRVRRDLLQAAQSLGARHIKVTPDGDNAPWDRAAWAAEFGRLAQQCDDVGVRLGIEFFPWANVGTLGDALQLVHDCGHPAAGIIVDAWHIFRAGTPVSDLADVPPGYIVGVELDDADEAPVGTLFEDTVHRRRFCGEGAFDLVGLVRELRTLGWQGPWGVEILSDEYRAMSPVDALTRAALSARGVLAAT